MRKILNILLWIGLPLGVLALSIFAQNHYFQRTLTALNVDINYSKTGESNRFLTYEDVTTFVRHRYDSLEGRKIEDIIIEQIEKDLLEIPYVLTADAYITMDAQLQVRINQRRALVRVIDVLGDQFYLDEKARMIPIRSFYPARVLVCNGVIPSVGFYKKQHSPQELDSLVESSILNDIYRMAKYIDADSLLRKQIVQLNVNFQGEFVLVPLVSNHIIKFGKAEDIDEKFKKLKVFYTDGLGHHRWNNYKVINLKYKNQIVCTKN